MKKFLAILMAAMMLLSCTALAETVKFVEESNDFDITIELGDDVDHLMFPSEGGIPMAHFQKKAGGAHVFVIIEASEQFDGNLKDLSEEDRQLIIADLSMDISDDVEVMTETTPKGNMYFHIHANDNTDVEFLWTLYAGYGISFTLFPDDGAEITQADHDFMMQLFYDLDIVPVAK